MTGLVLVKPKLFNETGSDSFESQTLIGGNPTGIANLNNQRYTWVAPLMREMLGNFWIPQKVGLDDDKPSRLSMTEEEKSADEHTISFLAFLDNLQIANLPNISSHITNPGVRNLLTVQAFQEVIHSESYQYGLLTFHQSMDRDRIYNLWRDNEVLKERNKTIALIAEEFEVDKSPEAFIKVVAANIALEGVYFYSGFNYYDVLAHRNRMVQWNKIIDYIRKDEFTHLGIFVNIVKESIREQVLPRKKIEDIIYSVMESAVTSEISWARHVYGNKILGISEKSSTDHPRFLGNDRLTRMGLSPIWDVARNPYQHILDAQEVGGNRKNFFETTVTDYDTAASLDGWDEF